MTECICASETICFEQQRERASTHPKSKDFTWKSLWRLAEAVGCYAVEVYRSNNDAQQQFSNGGARVLIRPDRIDLA